MNSREETIEMPADATTARLRFAVGVAHLTALAGLLHTTTQARSVAVFDQWQLLFAGLLVICSCAAFFLAPGHGLRRMRASLMPCFSLPPWNEAKTRAWLPGFGWQQVTPKLRTDVQKRFAVPMVVIAVLVLPLFAVEHFYRTAIESSPLLTGLVATAGAAVWASFTFEFIICCTLAEKKFAYIKRHWLDALIILLPLVAFLRVARLARLARIQQTARVFRLRGVAMRLWHAIIVFEVLERILFSTPEKQLAHLEKKRASLLDELASIDSRIDQTRDRLETDLIGEKSVPTN